MSKARRRAKQKARQPASRNRSTQAGREAGRPSRPRGRAPLRRPWWRSGWAVGGAIALAIAVGVAVQATRSGTGSGSGTPRNALGPGGSEIEGKASAPVLVEQYGDFQCPNCGIFQRETGGTIKQLVDAGTIRFAYYPIAILGSESLAAANAAVCAGDAGTFWPYHNALFADQAPENSGRLTPSYLIGLGTQVGITSSSFSSCVSDGTHDDWVRKLTDDASKRGVVGTPTVFVNGQQLQDLSAQGLQTAVSAAAAGA